MKLCLGTAQLGMDYGVQGDMQPELKKACKLLNKAVRLGITVFDTAGAYGDAEKVIGMFLAENQNKEIRIISKLSGTVLENINLSDYNQTILDNLKQSLSLLRVDKLDAYYFHNASYIKDIDKLRSLWHVKESALIDNTGISVYTPDEALIAANSQYIDYIQVPYNSLDHRLDLNDFFKIAKENGKTVFVRSVFLQGLLTMNAKQIPDYASHTKTAVQQFHKIVQHHGYTPLEGCLAYIKANPFIDYYVLGVANQQQLYEIVDAFNNVNEVSAEYINDLRRGFLNIDEQIINPALWRK